MSLPPGPFSIIYADPPWRYDSTAPRGAAAGHYPTMSVDAIRALPVGRICAPDAALFLWSTWPLLREALSVMDAWGFKYKNAAFVWVKRNKKGCGHFCGMGRWTRGNSEACLLGLRGKPRRIGAAVRQICFEPVGAHSEKPPVVRDRIVELLGDLPRLEMFARAVAPGWAAWGDEAPRKDAA